MAVLLFGRTQDALGTPFEPNRNPQFNGNPGPSGLSSLETQSAIEEARATAPGTKSRYVSTCGYGGQAKGKFLEFTSGSPGDNSPFVIPEISIIKSVSCSFRSGSIPIGTFVLYKNGVAVQTFTMTTRFFSLSGLSISLIPGDYLYVMGDNGSGTSLLDPCFNIFIQVVE